ncbi:Protein shisa-5, partial [Heterocephalus glaber]
ARGEECTTALGGNSFPKLCPDFCCGSCSNQYCCSDVLKRLVWTEDECAVPEASFPTPTEPWEQLGSALRFRSSFDSDPMSGSTPDTGLGSWTGLGSHCRVFNQIPQCLACDICLTPMCFEAAIVTTTTATTVVHAPYPQPPSAPPSYPGPTYQGYHPMPPQPGMPAAPYLTQYPPPYPAQPMGPPAYHETLTGGAAASQPPYNPAYMDPPKAAP